MKDTIYTIPLTDAFKSQDECPFCFIHKKLEDDAISFSLGASYMEEDFREQTDKLGFCSEHYKKLYDYGNRLGLALILQTHYQKLYNDIEKSLKQTSLPSTSFMQKLTKKSNTSNSKLPICEIINQKTSSCFVCNRIEKDMERYSKTFFYLLSTNKEFKQLFINSKGFCLSHFSEVLDAAPYHLNNNDKEEFLSLSKKMLLESLKRIEDEVSWFIDKHDHRYSKEPWKNSQDAVPRAIQKISSIYPHLQPLKENK